MVHVTRFTSRIWPLFILFPTNLAFADAGIKEWEWLGPGNAGGRIRAIAVHPTDPNILYVGGLGGGVWKSTNGGDSWFVTDDFMKNLQVGTLVMAPSDPNVLYAGTGESFAVRGGSRRDGKQGDGVFKTVDGGATWMQLPGTANWRYDGNRYVNRITVSPTNPDHVLVATDAGIHLSTDGGTNLMQVYTSRVVDLKFNPNNPLQVVGGRAPDSANVSTHNHVAIYSADGGSNWSTATYIGHATTNFLSAPASAGATNISVLSSAGFFNLDVIRIGTGTNAETVRIRDDLRCEPAQITVAPALQNSHSADEEVLLLNSQRTEIAWAASEPSSVYLSVGSGGGTIWRSDDGGMTYHLRSNPNGQGHVVSCLTANYLDYTTTQNTPRAFYNNVIWVAPDNDDLVIVGGLEFLRSLDGGYNFERLTERFSFKEGLSVHSDQHAVAAHARFGVTGDPNRETIFVGNDGGIQRVADIRTITTGSPWSNIGSNNLGVTQFYGGAASADGEYLIGGSQDLDILSRGPGLGPLDWYLYASAGDGNSCAIDDRNPSNPVFYRIGNGPVVQKSFDQGLSYSAFISGLDSSLTFVRGYAIPFVMDPNDYSNLVLGSSKIWRSTNGATNWVQIRGEVGDAPACSALDVAVGPITRIWAGYDDGKLSRTLGTVISWIDITSTNLPQRRVSDIAIDPDDINRVFVTFGGYPGTNDPVDTVWYTSDNGVSWEQRTGQPPFALAPEQVNTLTIHPDRTSWIYTGTDVGVFASENRGESWRIAPLFETNEGPANTSVQHLFWDGSRRLYAATYGRGMFRATVPVNLYVDKNYAGVEKGTLTQPFNTVREAEQAAGNGTDIFIRSSTYDEVNPLQLDKRGDIRATDGSATIR
jgi:hypothetical protein